MSHPSNYYFLNLGWRAVDVRIIGKDGRTRWFREHTPVADALRKRQVSQNAMSVITLNGYEEVVSNIAERIIYS